MGTSRIAAMAIGHSRVPVLLLGVWVVAHASSEDATDSKMTPHDSKVCTVHEDSWKVVSGSKHPIASKQLAFGGKSSMSACITACATHPSCMEAQFDSKSNQCYRATSHHPDLDHYERKPGSSVMRCELAKKNARSKMCKSFTGQKHHKTAAGDQMALDKQAVFKTEHDCLSPCAASDGCMEATWDKQAKRCYLSKKAHAHFHASRSDSGAFKVLQCIGLSDEQVQNAEPITDVSLNATAAANQTEVVQEVESPEAAKLAEQKAAQQAKALKAKAAAQAAQLANEKKEKVAAAKKAAAAAAQAKATAEAIKLAASQKQKKLAKKAAAAAAEKSKKAAIDKVRLIAEGKVKKEKSDKAMVLQKLAEAKKERTIKALQVAQLGKEKRQKSDQWYRKGHLLFAQGIKYQTLLEKLQKSHTKLDAYHFQEELETYSKAFPQGFTSPLEAKDGELGKTSPAGAPIMVKKNVQAVEEFLSW